ncbi:family 43 glycosylhydrolase [Silvibacterium sp.]|uniref:family 43 glycosylhydrolase n=1 Tax=Silvibacterium sp. TaxID=1964179 RepID=UPI0039E4DA6F
MNQLRRSFRFWIFLVALVNVFTSMGAAIAETKPASQPRWDAPHHPNPFIPGYYADASVLQTAKDTFVYATEDPWGGRTLGCWRSADLEHWSWCSLNWPTKEAATSPTSGDSMVWAPSVIAKNGRYHMYVAVGSEVWTGVADSPTGPWKNPLGNKPLIPGNYRPGYHMIDAEVFLDTDGQAYLYWGSGLHWVNGHCFVVKLKPDMKTFDGEPRDVTPAHYFEAPFLYKHGGKYFLMYSEGKTTDSTYNVRYAVGSSPMGPFHEGVNSPLLVSDEANSILGPGHHAIFERGGKSYIVYHRHSLPFDSSSVRRQLCMDELTFSVDGEPQKIVPTHLGPALLRKTVRDAGALPATASASSSLDAIHDAKRVTDDNYATRWIPAAADKNPWLELDLHKVVEPSRTEIRFEYAWKPYHFKLLASVDGKTWTAVENHDSDDDAGSPVTITGLPRVRYLRLEFPVQATPVSIFEWDVY